MDIVNRVIPKDAGCTRTHKHTVVLHQNIQSLKNKVLDIEEFITSMDDTPHVLCFTEHWCHRDEISSINIPGYRLLSAYIRDSHIHGGSCIFTKNDMYFQECGYFREINIDLDFESSVIVSRSQKLVVITIYRSPLGDINIFFEKLQIMLSKCHSRFVSFNIVLAGDFNIDLNKCTMTTRVFWIYYRHLTWNRQSLSLLGFLAILPA